METVSVSSKFQVVIPKSIRKTIALEPGDKIVMVEKNNIVHLVKIRDIRTLKGKYKKLSTKGLRDESERI